LMGGNARKADLGKAWTIISTHTHLEIQK
jgi:hypothetical protein